MCYDSVMTNTLQEDLGQACVEPNYYKVVQSLSVLCQCWNGGMQNTDQTQPTLAACKSNIWTAVRDMRVTT